MPDTFPKYEKLCGKKHIEQLYREGKRFTAWPLRVTYMPAVGELPTTNQVLVWAPKSLFKHAVDRNRLRRLMREAYRRNKNRLNSNSGGTPAISYYVAFNYIDRERQPYAVVEKAVCKALKKITNDQSPLTNDQ